MKTILLGLALCLTFAAALAQNLSVTFPKDGAVFQRNGTQGTISVMGSYNSVSFSHSFRTVRATLRKLDVRSGQVIQPEVSYTFVLERRNSFFPGSTFFAGKITVDQGWYELTTQVFNNLFSFTPIGSPDIRKVGVGEVFIIAGQSNAQGLPNYDGTTDKVTAPPFGGNYTFDGVRVNPSVSNDVLNQLNSLGSTSSRAILNFLVNYGQDRLTGYLLLRSSGYTNPLS